jgi:adenylate kinase family enzyme
MNVGAPDVGPHTRPPRRVCVIASASGTGKTTFGRALAARLGVPFHELDALNHGPRWTEATAEELRALVEPLVASPTWVIDGAYRSKLGDLVLARADTVVWLDLPRRVWLPRLLRRTARRVLTREKLWNGNRETLHGVLWARDALIPIAWRSFAERRRRYPSELAPYPVVRLRTTRDVARFLATAGPRGRSLTE